jgi:hypothetical protein
MKTVLGPQFESIVLATAGTREIQSVEKIQNLWSGYGRILRCVFDDEAVRKSLVVKHVNFPDQIEHPRGWSGAQSHDRKMRSYEIEAEFYRNWSDQCGNSCRIPHLLAYEQIGEELLLVLEDLDGAGFPGRLQSGGVEELRLCLRWLANFHASFLTCCPDGLWEVGTYWHLATRPDELAALEDVDLKNAAGAIDAKLTGAKFQTLVHGDAKLANFCFSENGGEVAAVDFQYVGGGCGMKDVAYLVGSCLDEEESEAREEEILDIYFENLSGALQAKGSEAQVDQLIAEWQSLYHFAWADFHRFLKGWCPGHWKINSYSERIVREVIAGL